MTISHALQQASTQETARQLARAGISVIPAIGKRAASSWTLYQMRRASLREVNQWFTSTAMNVAIVCGTVSNNLVVMDCDGWDAVNAFEDRFPHLLDTLTVNTGSGNGRHYYYRTPAPRTVRAKGFELRGDGCYVIAPPSKHPSSLALYEVEFAAEPMFVPDMTDLWAWISSKQQRAAVRPQQQHPQRPPAKSGGIKNPTAYARAALRSECGNVRLASAGNRNNVLYSAALRIGNLVGLGWISRDEAERELLASAAALLSTDGERQTLATINSGIDTGIRSEKRGLA